MNNTVSLLHILAILLITQFAGAADLPPKGACLVCHKLRSPELFQAWIGSTHARHNVTCLDCHEAAPGEPDAFAHGGATISLLVTPKDCAGCHEVEASQYESSSHAASAVDAVKQGDWGDPATCRDCHGALNLLNPQARNRVRADSWPDRGTGRLNPDGSRGSCAACHTDHAFSPATARLDASCRVCHTQGHNPHHAGVAPKKATPVLVPGETTTCAGCHLAAGSGPTTHDPAQRRRRGATSAGK